MNNQNELDQHAGFSIKNGFDMVRSGRSRGQIASYVTVMDFFHDGEIIVQNARKSYVPWLNGLELDVYVVDKLAIEYNGKQHYDKNSGFYGGSEEKFTQQKINDALKVQLCEDKIHLLVIPYTVGGPRDVRTVIYDWLVSKGYRLPTNKKKMTEHDMFIQRYEFINDLTFIDRMVRHHDPTLAHIENVKGHLKSLNFSLLTPFKEGKNHEIMCNVCTTIINRNLDLIANSNRRGGQLCGYCNTQGRRTPDNIIEDGLTEYEFELIETFNSDHTGRNRRYAKVKCLRCDKISDKDIDNIRNTKYGIRRGCNCWRSHNEATMKKKMDAFDRARTKYRIEPMSDYKDRNIPCKWICLKCDYIFSDYWGNICSSFEKKDNPETCPYCRIMSVSETHGVKPANEIPLLLNRKDKISFICDSASHEFERCITDIGRSLSMQRGEVKYICMYCKDANKNHRYERGTVSYNRQEDKKDMYSKVEKLCSLSEIWPGIQKWFEFWYSNLPFEISINHPKRSEYNDIFNHIIRSIKKYIRVEVFNELTTMFDNTRILSNVNSITLQTYEVFDKDHGSDLLEKEYEVLKEVVLNEIKKFLVERRNNVRITNMGLFKSKSLYTNSINQNKLLEEFIVDYDNILSKFGPLQYIKGEDEKWIEWMDKWIDCRKNN